MNLVILLDLNHTLVANSDERRQPFTEQIAQERYRRELALLTVPHLTLLVTARPARYQEATLNRIREQLGVGFNGCYCNDRNEPPHIFKRRIFKEEIQKNFPGATFLAIESNPRTIAEYKKLGILCLTVA